MMYTFEELKNIVEELRSEHGCSWDRAQTHETMKKHLVEECGEVLEAIDNRDSENLCEELGDMLFQVMIHSQIEKELQNFTIEDVIDGVCQKMVRRHPHVFGDEEMRKKGGNEDIWQQMKKLEKEQREKARENGKKP